MSLVKTSVTIPDNIYKKAKEVSANFSEVVTIALEEYIRKIKINKAIASFGKWNNIEKNNSVEIVNEMRKEEGRKYADYSD